MANNIKNKSKKGFTRGTLDNTFVFVFPFFYRPFFDQNPLLNPTFPLFLHTFRTKKLHKNIRPSCGKTPLFLLTNLAIWP